MSSTEWSARKEAQALASGTKMNLPRNIQDALQTGDNPAPILTWLSQNRKDLAKRFVKNEFTDAILTFSNDAQIESENVFQKMQVFCCNAFLGTGNVQLKVKKRELIDLFNKLAPTFQKKISANKNKDKLFPPLDEMKIFVGALDKVTDNGAISEACREFLERMKLLPSRDTIGIEARKVRVVALEPNEHNNERDCAKAKMLAGKAEIISSAEPIQKVVIKELMSRITSSWSHENVSLMLGNLEKVLNFPECSSLRKFQKLCQENEIRFEISESLILNLSNAPNLSFDELLLYLETHPLHQFAVREIKNLLSARAQVDKDAARGRQDILSGGSIDYAPTPHSINSQPEDWDKINSTRDEDIFLIPPRLDPGPNLGKKEDKTLSSSLHSDKKDNVGLWKRTSFTGEGEDRTAEGGEIEGTPSIFPGIDDADDEFTHLLANSKLKKETPSVDDEEADSDPNSPYNPSKPLLGRKPNPNSSMTELDAGSTFTLPDAVRSLFSSKGQNEPKGTDAKKTLETNVPTKKESDASLNPPKKTETPEDKGKKKEPKKKDESRKGKWPFSTTERTTAGLPEGLSNPLERMPEDVEVIERKPRIEEKEVATRKKKGAGQGRTPHMPHKRILDRTDFSALDGGYISDGSSNAPFANRSNHKRTHSDPLVYPITSTLVNSALPALGPKLARHIHNDTDEATDKELARMGQLFPLDEDEFSASGGGAIRPAPLVPAVTTSAASGPALHPGSSTTHLVTGLSPFYRELRGVYYHLKDDPEGHKHISIPMLKQYIAKLKEIEASQDLKVNGKNLWQTLNPAGADFQAKQLLEENILDKALEQHKDLYLPEFKSKLNVNGGIYEPQGKCYYFEKKEGIIYLMLKIGAQPSRMELQEAYREYNVICQDMFDKTGAEIYICDSEFNRDPKNQKEVAAIVTRLDVILAEDNQVQGNNKAVHEAVHKISIKMKDPEPVTASKVADESKFTAETLLNYRLMLDNSRCTLLEAKEFDGLEREQYLDMVYEWEKDPNWTSYLQGVSTVSRLLPDVTKESYKKEKVLVHLNPMELKPEELKKVEQESIRRDTGRRLLSEKERQIEATIRRSSQPVEECADWLEKDIATAKSDAEAFAGNEESEFARAVQESLKTYLKEHYTTHNVSGDGNCFYRAAADQAEQQGISRFNRPNVELHVSLRQLVQGKAYKNGEWAGVRQLFTLIEKAHVIVAVMDTRHPHLGFRCYYRNKQGNLAETYDSDALKRQAADQTIIHLAYTGGHYMSVRGYQALTEGAIRGTWNVAERQQLQPEHAESVEQSQRRPNVVPETQRQLGPQSNSVHQDVQSQSLADSAKRQPQSEDDLDDKENIKPKPDLKGQHNVRLKPAVFGTKRLRTAFEQRSERRCSPSFFQEAAESNSSSVTLSLGQKKQKKKEILADDGYRSERSPLVH